MSIRSTALALAAVGVFAAGTAEAHVIHYKINLNGPSMIPANNSPNYGFGDLYFNEHSGIYSMFVEVVGIKVDDLVGEGPNNTPFHFHFGSATEHGDMSSDVGWEVLFGPSSSSIVPTANGFRIEVIEALEWGSQGNFDPPQLENLFAFWEQRQWMDIHTAAFPGGEIRGQWIDVTPAPGSVALVGFGAMAALRRRR